jgi:uncharacterized protein
MRSENLDFPGAEGQRLAARIDRPEGKARALALFAHCFTCGKDVLAAARIAGRLAEHGIGVLRFDFTGLGASEGEFADTHFSSNIADLAAAADFMRTTYEAPRLLIGHSLGGAAVLAVAARIPEARAVVTIGAPSDPAHVMRLFAGSLDTIRAEGDADVRIAGREFRIRHEFVQDLEAQDLASRIGQLDRALLVMHSPMDRTVDISNAASLYEAARHPKSFVALPDADHLLSGEGDAAYAADVIAAWSGRYLAAD